LFFSGFVDNISVKVAVLHSDANSAIARNAGQIIIDNSCSVFYTDTGTVWDKNLIKNPLSILDGITHLLYVHSSVSHDFVTFAFYAGLALGRGVRVLILETDGDISIPSNCMHLGVLLNLSTFEENLIAERSRFLLEDTRNFARKTLLEKGISCFDDNFIRLVQMGDVEAVLLFLDAGFSHSITDAAGTPVLSLAVRAQVPEVVNILVAAGADVNRQSQDRGYSPLMDAAQKGDVVIAEILLKHGAHPDMKSRDGQTALIICAGRGDVEFSRLLVRYGADPEIKDSLGMSALAYAKLFRNEKLMELFNKPSA